MGSSEDRLSQLDNNQDSLELPSNSVPPRKWAAFPRAVGASSKTGSIHLLTCVLNNVRLYHFCSFTSYLEHKKNINVVSSQRTKLLMKYFLRNKPMLTPKKEDENLKASHFTPFVASIPVCVNNIHGKVVLGLEKSLVWVSLYFSELSFVMLFICFLQFTKVWWWLEEVPGTSSKRYQDENFGKAALDSGWHNYSDCLFFWLKLKCFSFTNCIDFEFFHNITVKQ